MVNLTAVNLAGVKWYHFDLTLMINNIEYFHILVNHFLKIYLICMIFCLHVCEHIVYVPSTLRGQKRVLDPLKLETVMVVSHPVDTGKQTRVLWKNKCC